MNSFDEPEPRNARIRPRKARIRQGAAMLILVVLVLLVLLGTTRMVVQSESTARRGEKDRLKVRILTNAIRETATLVESSGGEIRLPVDDATNQSIRVTFDAEASRVIASWLKNEQVIDRLSRPVQ